MTLHRRTIVLPLTFTAFLLVCAACQSPDAQDSDAGHTGVAHVGKRRSHRDEDVVEKKAQPGDSVSAELIERDKAVHAQLADTSDGQARFRLLEGLQQAYSRSNRIDDALRIESEIADDSRIPAGRRSLAASDVSIALGRENDFARSEHRLADAKSLAQDMQPAELETLPIDPVSAYQMAEAEIARRYWVRLDLALHLLRDNMDRAWRDYDDPALSRNRHRAAANVLLNDLIPFTNLLVRTGRDAEALSYTKEIGWVLDNGPRLPATQQQRAQVAVARAIALSSFDDYDAALDAINSAIDGYRQAGVPNGSRSYLGAIRIRLMIALALGRIEQYRDDAIEYQRADLNPTEAGRGNVAERAALISAAQGDWDSAHRKIDESLEPRLRKGRRSHVRIAADESVRVALQLMYALEDPHDGVDEAQIARYVTPILGTDDDWDEPGNRGVVIEDGVLAASMARLMQVGASGQVLAFRIAEQFHMNATQGAMADGAARIAAETPGLRALIEQEQALRYQASTDPSSSAGADAKLRSLRRQIVDQFPLYRQLVAPVIPTPAEVGAVLRPGEVYVDLYAGRGASYAFIVHPGGAFRAVVLDANRAALRKLVTALRAGFDAGLPPTRPDELAGFDLDAAAKLYAALIAPIEPDLRGATTVYLSTSGVLASIPYEVLMTRPASTLSDAHWLVDAITPVRMPSASALVLARGQHSGRAREPLIAFADPSFDGSGAAPDANTRTVAGARAFPLDSRAAAFDYRRVTPLPETLDEARAIAAALGAPNANVLSGTRASRSQVLKEDMSNDRVVLFATHGVTPGEVPGINKAGLALAYEGRGLPDSILTADDIVTLRLNADWVVLSACNTGLATGDAGNSVSALSRAFFAAGARTMLVTQWAVESKSAAQVTSGLFAAYSADATLSKAQALARVERDMSDGKYGALYRHPYFWGAYFLAGDAAR